MIAYPFTDVPAAGTVLSIAPGIRWVRVEVPGPLGHVNCWLLDEPGGVAIVDTGLDTPVTRDAWAQIFAGALAGTRVTRVIGTHFHPDHIGLAGHFCAEHAAPLHMTRTEWLYARMLVADARDEVPAEMQAFWRMAGWSDEQVAQALTGGWRYFGSIVAPLPIGVYRLRDGQALPIGERTWRVVVGSGHSPEHACLLDEANGVLIAGDQVLPRISSNISLTVSEPDADPLGEWFDSLAKLGTLPADLLVLPGHGEPFTGLHERLRDLADEHSERLDALHILLAEPRRASDVFPALFRRPIGSDMRGLATGEALAHLRRLEREGRATTQDRDGVRWWIAT